MSLRARFLASLAGALALSMALGCMLAGWHAAQSVRTELVAAQEIAVQTVQNALDELVGAADQAREPRRLVQTFDGDRHVEASLLDARGLVLVRSRLLTSTVKAPGWFRTSIAPKLAPVRIALRAPGELGGATAIQIRTDPSNEVGEVWGECRDAALVLAVFCALTSVAVSWTLSRALRSVESLLAGLSRIASGDYEARVAEIGPHELKALATGFNHMAAQLAAVRSQNAQLQEQLLTLQDEERADVARDLHDEIGPSLFAANVTAATILHLAAETGCGPDIPAQARAIQDAVAHVQRHVRGLLRRLRPMRAVEFGLAAAIGDLIAFWRARHPGIVFSVKVSASEVGMDEALKEAVYRIVQESLSNAVRHGMPGAIEVVVDDGAAGTLVRVSDDGAGAAPRPAARPGFGLAGMGERVAALGGTLATGPTGREVGWTVEATLPPANAPAPA